MTEPKISVHMLAKEETELGRRLFLSAVESVLEADYAHQLVILDNGCKPEIIKDVEDLTLKYFDQDRIDWTSIVESDSRDFSELRNKCLELTRDECSHFHWIDTDEIYPKNSLDKIKRVLVQQDPAAVMNYFTHFMIDPLQWQLQQNKINVYKLVPGLRWNKAVHEHLLGYDEKNVIAANAHYLHFGYIRPQWMQALKWLRYDVWEKGHANGYREYFDEGWNKVVDYYHDDRTPNQCLEDRREYCQPYEGSYPPAFRKYILDPWDSSRLQWDDWLDSIMDWQTWVEWQVEREAKGSWKETIGWACRHIGLREKLDE